MSTFSRSNSVTKKPKNTPDMAEENFFNEGNSLSYPETKDEWLEEESYEGQLSVDVYQTDKDIVIKSTIAGVKPEDIDVSINKDLLTIKGMRRKDTEVAEENYLYRECYWGGFSRSIVLPVEIKPDKVEASLENGVLTVVLPKAQKNKSRSIRVKEIKEK